MSRLNRKQLKKMILQEFKMIGMTGMQPMGKIGAFSQGHDDMMSGMEHADDDMESSCADPMEMDHGMSMPMGMSMPGSVSREDCCIAVMCMIECCSCPATKQALMECCQDIMSGHYDK